MTAEERPFTPDTVDERLDRSSSTFPAPSSSDERLIQSLHALYAAEEREMTHALTRGQERLSQSLASWPTTQQRDGPASDAVRVLPASRSVQLPQGGQRWPPRLASLAAAVLLVALVGSLIAGLILVRHTSVGAISKPSVTPPSATPTSTPAQTNLYLVSTPDDSIVKVDTSTRSIRWTYTFEPSQAGGFGFGGMLAGDGSVYFAAGFATDGNSDSWSIYALNAQDGSLRWRNTSLANGVSTLLIEHGVIYVSAGTNLYALNASDGSPHWGTQVGDNVNRLALAGGVLYGTTFEAKATHWSSTLFALRAADGALLWQSPLPDNKSFTVEAVVNGAIYLTSVEQKYPSGGAQRVQSDGKPKISYVYAYSLSGKQLWQSQQFEGFLSNLSIGGEAIYFAGTDAYALRASDGTLLWDYPLDAGMILYNGFVYANGTVYLESGQNGTDGSVDSFLVALDGQSGHEQWKQKLGSSVFGGGPFVLGNGFLYVVLLGIASSSVEAFNVGDGSLAWQVSLGKPFVPSLLIAGP